MNEDQRKPSASIWGVRVQWFFNGLTVGIAVAMIARWDFRGPAPKVHGERMAVMAAAEPEPVKAGSASPAPPEPATGSMLITTVPEGAKITWDHALVGESPVVVNGLSLGEHSLKVTHGGFEDVEESVTLTKNKPVLRKAVSLRRSMGWLDVFSEPPGLTMTLSAAQGGVIAQEVPLPWKSEKLPAGEYSAVVTRPGWRPLKRTIDVSRDNQAVVSFSMQGGSLAIASTPSKAKVFLEGKQVGVTPYAQSGVEPGEKRFVLVLRGFEDLPLDVMVSEGGSSHLDGLLKKGPVSTWQGIRPADPAPHRPASDILRKFLLIHRL
ncbi:MAG TPA: PEGA domain-containing protein [Chthoniobacteraceae bacterium]|jgi:hypothetical protein|nr:PEGA domain-containing protein [Chthoniobacteraceae bacterium]